MRIFHLLCVIASHCIYVIVIGCIFLVRTIVFFSTMVVSELYKKILLFSLSYPHHQRTPAISKCQMTLLFTVYLIPFDGIWAAQVSYTALKEKWRINKLISICVQEEEKLSRKRDEKAHLMMRAPSKKSNKNNKRLNFQKKCN